MQIQGKLSQIVRQRFLPGFFLCRVWDTIKFLGLDFLIFSFGFSSWAWTFNVFFSVNPCFAKEISQRPPLILMSFALIIPYLKMHFSQLKQPCMSFPHFYFIANIALQSNKVLYMSFSPKTRYCEELLQSAKATLHVFSPFLLYCKYHTFTH